MAAGEVEHIVIHGARCHESSEPERKPGLLVEMITGQGERSVRARRTGGREVPLGKSNVRTDRRLVGTQS